MPRSEIPFHPGATQDHEEAYVWYFGHSIDLAAEFEREIDRGLRLIADNPLRWPKFDAERRRLVLRKFPYSIVYEIIKEKIVVLAIAHGRRRPYYPGVTGRGKGRIDPWFARNRVMIESESGHNRAVDEGSRGVRV